MALVLPTTQCGYLSYGTCTGSNEQRVSTVEIRFRDPSQVALLAGDGRVLVPAGAAPIVAGLGSGTVGGPWVTGAYAVRLTREAGGALSIDWQTDLPMASGHRELLVLPDGTFPGFPVPTDIPPEALGFSGVLKQPDLVLALCVALYGPLHAAYTPQLGACGGGSWPRFLISTPWSNVVFLRRDTHDNPFGNDNCPTHRTSVVLYPPSGQP
jgi:hypothetical protein